MEMPQHTYWATLKDDEFLDVINTKIGNYYDFLELSGLHRAWKRSYIAYYGGDLNNETNLFESSHLSKGGKIGEITKIKVNTFRNLVKHSVNLAVANKTSLNCVASNTDYRSDAQTILGSSLLDYYLKVEKVGQKNRKATELACVTGEGWIHAPWAPKKGKVYDVDDKGKEQYEGDLDASYHNPLDIIRDTNLKSADFSWLCLRQFKNKWDYVAKHPELKEQIIQAEQYEYENCESFRFEITKAEGEVSGDSELFPVYTFYHAPTEAMPNGRLVEFSQGIIFYDGDLPYPRIPLKPVMPDVLHESPFGYSPFFDLLSIQQAKDNLVSAVTSNNMTFANQFIWKRKGDGFSVKNLGGGLKMLESAEPPQPINLTASSPETYQLIQLYETFMETLSGISSTVRGNPQANLKSGAALALVVSQSIQFGNALEESYNELLEDVGTTIIEHLQTFAKTPRIAFIVGESNRPFMKEYTADDISEIRRVTVQQTNALSKTISGRLEIANQVMQMPPEQAKIYMSILNTGQLPAEWQTQSSVLNVKAENEDLRRGADVRAVISENHANHIKHHMEIIENPEAKQDEELMARTLTHIQEHLDLWRTMDPALLMITGQQPPPPDNSPATILQQNQMGGMPMQPAPMMPPPGPAGMPQGAVPQGVPAMGRPEPVQGPEVPGQANMPNMPGMPAGTPPEAAAQYQNFLGKI